MSGTGPSAGQDVAANRELWAQVNAEYSAEHAFGAWAAGDITWGVFNVPEGQPGVLGDVSGPDVVELGCGTAHFSAWLAGRGPGRWAWASAPPSWPPRAAARNGSGSGSRSSRRTPELSRCLTGASTWPSPSAGRACGVTRPAGCPRPPVCCAQVGGWCFHTTSVLVSLCLPRRPRLRARAASGDGETTSTGRSATQRRPRGLHRSLAL